MAVESLGDRLKRARLLKRLTLERAAEHIGVKLNTVWRYEKGEIQPSEPVLRMCSQVYEQPMAWLLGDDAPAEPDPQGTADPEQTDIESEREFVMNAASLALRAASPNLSDESIRLIADYIRFVEEREERERRERDGGA